jgi:hypothetical protein
MTARATSPARRRANPVHQPSLRASNPLVQRCGSRACPGGACHGDQDEGPRLQRRSGAPRTPPVPQAVHDTLRAPGQALDGAVRALMEHRFGHDFGAVRVHTDARASASASAVDADAYTVGRHIVFGRARYSPGTAAGQRLLAHELTHVVQQAATGAGHGPVGIGAADSPAEREAEAAAGAVGTVTVAGGEEAAGADTLRRRVRRENVSCRESGLTNPDLTGDEVVAALEAADAEAISLAQGAEDALTQNLADVRAGGAVDPDFDTILQEELGLSLTNVGQFGLVEQQRNRFRRVRETLESGYLRYLCRGGTVNLVGCGPGTCGPNFAFTCPGNRLVVLCQAFWDQDAERPGTLLHEPFHIWFHMARHDPSALRRADASCFESFARRIAGEVATPFTCVGHTGG